MEALVLVELVILYKLQIKIEFEHTLDHKYRGDSTLIHAYLG